MTLYMQARSFSFGQFKLLAQQQRLLRNDSPVRLGSRALAILSVLLEQAGELVSKQDLMSRVWPDTFVDESNLKVNIAALRKALDEDNDQISHIANVSGRGYRFTAPVSIDEPGGALQDRRRSGNLPHPIKQVVGRQQTIQQILTELAHSRLLTIVGSAGVGKTTIATAVAEELFQNFRDGVFFADLSSLRNPDSAPHAISAALGLPASVENAFQELSAYLPSRHVLLVVDSCECVLPSVAECLERVLSSCPGVHIVATSREPLGARGERLYRLPPLGVPPEKPALTLEEARAFPAVELFLERATESLGNSRIDDSQTQTVAELCRQLDGIPLAIELAASRVRLLGFEGLPPVAGDDFLHFQHNQRTAPRRHESLAAAYEWSFERLPANERAVLWRLSALDGSFELETAVSVASGGSMSTAETTACIANLVSKSLVERLVYGASEFRLLHLVRHFVSRKLISENGVSGNLTRQEHFAPSFWCTPSGVAPAALLTA